MTTLAQPGARDTGSAGAPKQYKLIDVDVHERTEMSALVPYLEPLWRKYITEMGWIPDRVLPFTQFTAGGLDRADSKLPDGRPGGSDLALMRSQLLDTDQHDYAVLTGWLDSSGMHPGWPEFKTALMTAYNRMEREQWLGQEQRLLGSIHVNANDPEGAVKEIERLAKDPRFVSVIIYIYNQTYGEPRYHPIYEAAARHGLTVGFHHTENTPTALGFHRYFIEWHTLVPQAFMSELVSLVFNGVFDKYPDLRVVMIEGGISYVPHILWRMDQQYKELRAEVPWVKRLPSEIVHEHVRFATQPVEEFTSSQILDLIGQVGSDDLFIYSTDYPHWDYDSPREAFPRDLPQELHDKIYWKNALKTYPRIPR